MPKPSLASLKADKIRIKSEKLSRLNNKPEDLLGDFVNSQIV